MMVNRLAIVRNDFRVVRSGVRPVGKKAAFQHPVELAYVIVRRAIRGEGLHRVARDRGMRAAASSADFGAAPANNRETWPNSSFGVSAPSCRTMRRTPRVPIGCLRASFAFV
jgi:hypothetical protein